MRTLSAKALSVMAVSQPPCLSVASEMRLLSRLVIEQTYFRVFLLGSGAPTSLIFTLQSVYLEIQHTPNISTHNIYTKHLQCFSVDVAWLASFSYPRHNTHTTQIFYANSTLNCLRYCGRSWTLQLLKLLIQ